MPLGLISMPLPPPELKEAIDGMTLYLKDQTSPYKKWGLRSRPNTYVEFYTTRHVEALKKDFPHTMRALSPEGFVQIAEDWLREEPPLEFHLNEIGRDFPRYLRKFYCPESIYALADVEALVVSAFWGKDNPTSPHFLFKWDLRLGRGHGVDIFYSKYDLLSFFRKETHDFPKLKDQWLVVGKRDSMTYVEDITEDEFRLLKHFFSGQTLGMLIEHDLENAKRIGKMMEQCLSKGYLCVPGEDERP